ARAILGLVPVRSGAILFKQQQINNLSPEQIVRQGISYVPQVANVFPSLSVLENLEMGAFLGDSKLWRSQKDKILDIFLLFINNTVYYLSYSIFIYWLN
ncbi:MAG: ATP-binding cassette domain-containing protein, partial [Richelia sp. SM1_7_0]|nr:ATP-binding cassette domain-containing protein [Richelia sp. SM1_7_0]